VRFLDTRRGAVAALALYCLISVAFFGFPVLTDPTGSVVGSFGSDQGFFMWSLVHWKLVVLEGAHPFLNEDIYAPDGFNLAWATVIPGPALLLVPLTATAGPVVAYNLLALLAPALAAWTAFLLCREVTRHGVAALAGGYLFGFSSYTLGQTLNHVNLALSFLLPLGALLVVRHARGAMSDRRFALGLAAVLVGQFLIFLEVLMTAVLAGGLALGAAILLADPRARPALLHTAKLCAAAAAIAVVVVSPYLYFALAHPNPIKEGLQPETYVADLENLLFPTQITWLFSGDFAEVSARFAGNLTEQLAYTPLPLLLIAGAAAFAFRRRLAGRVLTIVAIVAFVAALGAHLTIGGVPTVSLPWHLADRLPLVHLALPARFVVYTALAVAVLAAMWLAARPASPWRWLLLALSVAMLLPNPHGSWWRTEVPVPAFFADGTYRDYIARGETVVVIPYGVRGNSMYWQATTDRWFRMAGGYAAAVLPDPYARYPIVYALYGADPPANADEELRRFVRDKGVTSIVVQRSYPGNWRSLLSGLGVEPLAVDDVWLYRLRRA
jgi:hypothetical protein